MAGCALALVGAIEVAACGDDDSGDDAATGGEDGRGEAAGESSIMSGAGQTGALPQGGTRSTNAGAGGRGGAGNGGGAGPNPCEIDLAAFVHNGYRTCPPNDSAAVAGECWPQTREDDGRQAVCGSYRLWAFGHDGAIGCAYDATSGELVGGFLYGLPSSAPNSCVVAFAGPPALAHCPAPTTAWCRDQPSATGETGAAGGGAGGEAGASWLQGGAGGVATQGGTAGQL